MILSRYSKNGALWAAILLSGLLAACAETAPNTAVSAKVLPVQANSVVSSKTQLAWWSVKFQLQWEAGSEPKWYLGTWISGEILAPLLTQHAAAIKLWRMHRRAVQDESGYRFTFWFYSSAEVAEKIYAAVKQHALLTELQHKQLLKQLLLDDLQHNDKPDIADNSDPSWPLAIRKTWPYFIMGASDMWLQLIRELQAENAATTLAAEAKYQLIHDKITQLWRKQGQHAWLHHLSALYGYQTLEIEF